MTDQHLTVEQVDPSSLLVDLNTRTDVALVKDFLASIRDLGVLEPIVAVRTEDGALRVRYGHRRTLAAVEVGRATVPVVVAGEENSDEAERIVSQWHENEQRAGLSTADKVAAVEQLSLLSLSAGQIVKRLRAPKADVERALATAGSALAKGAAARYEFLTLDMAAAVADFDEDPETVKALIASAKTGEGDFEHTLQRARDEREAAARVAALHTELAEASVRVIERDHGDRSVQSIDRLVDAKGKDLTAARHQSCPGHAAYVSTDWRGTQIVYVCTQWEQAGHRDRYGSSGGSASAAAMTEEQKQERREVIANNKAWKSAEAVRRRWLTTFLARKTAPRGASVYLAGELARGLWELRRGMERSHQLAATLLGLDTGKAQRDVIAAATTGVSDARAQVIALGVVLGDIEETTGTQSWGEPSDTIRRYFAFLTANGYQPSDVEQLAAGGKRRKRRRTATEPASGDTAA